MSLLVAFKMSIFAGKRAICQWHGPLTALVRRAGSVLVYITEASKVIVFSLDHCARLSFPCEDVAEASVRFTPASGLSQTMALPEIEKRGLSRARKWKLFRSFDLNALGVQKAELLLTSCKHQWRSSTTIVASVTIGALPHTFRCCAHSDAAASHDTQ